MYHVLTKAQLEADRLATRWALIAHSPHAASPAGVAALPLTVFRAVTIHANLLAYFTGGGLVMRVCTCPTQSAMVSKATGQS